MSDIELVPCPLCGGPAHLRRVKCSGKEVYNASCGASEDDGGCGLVLFGSDETRDEMIDKWNHRASQGNIDGIRRPPSDN